ncbi:hypothetical protein JX265_008417 [Neoarthrinium moseri]|uniref:non-specific serine/threonine protein kinase n=1 Tax=Neoarthrinium moseri TaxID=1658444 RepID=A0A9Q0AM85_9PEZI|nr:hypothetical protein JX265_008417 [Neoarthrinium moseri]
MGPTSHGGPAPQSRDSFTNGAQGHGPPPSTLAAQLVDNISASTRSSRPDETAELKRFFTVIETVKNRPESLRTHEERVEHNHMLIYVYARLSLDGLKWDDPFAAPAQLHSEARNAINFLKITIKETPDVLLACNTGNSFIFRGREPLWAWVLPKVLRMLGRNQCLALTSAIEEFFQDIFLVACQTGSLWPLLPAILDYIRSNFKATFDHVLEIKSTIAEKDISLSLRLPVDSVLEETAPGGDLSALQQQCTYRINTVSHALRHASCLLNVVANLLSSRQLSSAMVSSPLECLPWLLDSCYELGEAHDLWHTLCPTIMPSLLQTAAQLTTILSLSAMAAGRLDRLATTAENGELLRQLLCSNILTLARLSLDHRPVAKLVSAQLLPILEKLSIHGDLLAPGTDLWRCFHMLQKASSGSTLTPTEDDPSLDQFNDQDLRQQLRRLNLRIPAETLVEPPSKRRKTSDMPLALAQVLAALCQKLGIADKTDYESLERIAKNSFGQLKEADQCTVIDLVGHACCAADGTMTVIEAETGVVAKFRCSHCLGQDMVDVAPTCAEPTLKSVVYRVFKALVDIPSFSESRRPRVLAMATLRRLVRHSNDGEFLHLESSSTGLWCFKSLRSSIRELRIAASRTLPVYLQDCALNHPCRDVLQKNRHFAVDILRHISEQNSPGMAETCIYAWSHFGRVLPDEQLNLTLLKLVEYLGHASIVAPAAAFDELFEPFWRHLAFHSVKDLASAPKLTRLLAELLELPIPEFLKLIQRDALPWLVLHKKRDVIQKIAEARSDLGTHQPILDKDNLGPIVALLLVQDAPDVATHAMDLLRHASSHFDQLSLGDVVLLEPVMICLELLKAAGDADDDHRPHMHAVLDHMVNVYHAANGETRHKKASATSLFLMDQVLGLVSCLTDIFNSTSTSRSTVEEQKRSIRAMREMIRIGGRSIRIARPQISACILSAISRDELRTDAFWCWAAMIHHLEEEDVEVLVETTFFIINHNWNSFDDATRGRSRGVIEFLLKKYQPLMEELISKLPSLSHINELSEVEARLNALRSPVDNRTAFNLLAERISHENSGVVLQALRELAAYLQRQQGYLQASAVSEQPDSVVSNLARALLDCCSRYATDQGDISRLCTQSLGLLGCLDPNRVETVRAERQVVVENNFEHSEETTDFVLVLLEDILVKSFLSATDTSLQGFLSYCMQALLDRCDISAAVKQTGQRGKDADRKWRKWIAISEGAREIISPFLNSRYRLQAMAQRPTEYPIFRPGRTYGVWMRNFTLDLLRKPQTPFAALIFEPLCRVIRLKDLSIAEYLFPFLILHVIIGDECNNEVKSNVLNELLSVLEHELPKEATFAEREDKKLYYETVFRVLDYAMRWLHLKRSRQNQTPKDAAAMQSVQKVLESVPAELISQRAVDCKAYSRALFHLEQHIRQVEQEKANGGDERERLLQRLQDIYAQIDEPDGLEGISAHLQVLDINQQILSHRKAGRWTAAQTWYEMRLAENPDNLDAQIELLTCLKESGQHDVLLNYVEGIEKHTAITTINQIVPYAVEASWATGRWTTMHKFISKYQGDLSENFNVSLAQALLHLQKGNKKDFMEDLTMMRDRISSSMTFTATSSLQTSHEAMLKCHVLSDLELVAGINNDGSEHPQETLKSLDRRLEVLGSYVNDKQYILSIRRAAMESMRSRFNNLDISKLWLSSARLARKANSLHQSFNAVLHAEQLGDANATIENARILWKQGHNRKAIQTLQSAVTSNVFANHSFATDGDSSEKNADSVQSMVTARAQLLLAKWLDTAGQTHASALRQQYQNVPKNYGQWEKGHYYLGRHYKKLLESEKALKLEDQSDEYLTGETAKLVIENYIRSLNYGTKYLYQTLPRILTLWLEMGAQVDKPPPNAPPKVSLATELHHRRLTQLNSLQNYLHKYLQRLPAYIFYTALPQIVARIAHPNKSVFQLLEEIILKVVEAHPKQALWSLFAIMTSTSKQANSDRRQRGQQILQRLRESKKKAEGGSYELKTLLRMGEKLANQLLLACNNGDFQSNRTTHASITRDLNFNHKCTPCPLVVPIETCLTATLPTLTDNVKKHKAFSRDVITIDCFLDEVLVLGSLAKPRRLTARGSDGKSYMLLIKPKDDLRTDQRLMEFNSMINRSLKRDAESSRRQLYIKTYAVTPLNEECGIIEWVDGLKTLRDILLVIYRSRGIVPNYNHLAQMMKDAALNEKNTKLFTDGVLGMFPPVLPQWFVSQFPNPSAWFAARLRYTRSSAVMSMVGTILGLGDRHGENVLLEEGNGGVFHVDFNCLFDKGLTFAQPERVPFRLTHNMVAAMGIHGYEGPFRKCSELTLSILRQQEETLMTILEAFIFDPTLDLQKDKKRKHEIVKLNPTSVVESIKRKVRGLLAGESIPLGVEGQVEELIKQAVNPRNLAAMYIGWCPFL